MVLLKKKTYIICLNFEFYIKKNNKKKTFYFMIYIIYSVSNKMCRLQIIKFDMQYKETLQID